MASERQNFVSRLRGTTSCRVTGCPVFGVHYTDLLEQNVPLEDVQYLAGHSNPRTTRIYDRRRRKVTRNIVERISI